MSGAQTREPLWLRHWGNPILSAGQWPYPAHSVFNPGATLLRDGSTLLLCRVEDQRGHSHLTAARSANGVDHWAIDPQPTLGAELEVGAEACCGLEDPRITYLEELNRYAVVYTSYGSGGPGVALALTEDFRSFQRLGLILPPDNKDAALLPRRIDGQFVLVHRPMTLEGAHIWLARSPDLRHWGQHQLMLRARSGAWWDAHKIGLSTPPLETTQGWLLLYHGVRQTAAGSIYRLGAALFALDQPEHCLLRGDDWIFGPETPYELQGDVGNVTFPCGCILAADGDTLQLYYGAADTTTALATGSLRQVLAWLEANGSRPAVIG